MTSVSFQFLKAGYCSNHEGFMIEGGSFRKKMEFPCTFGLIQHPKHGNILFDTGYSSHFHEATKSYPEKLYAQVTPVTVKPEETSMAQLQKRGIAPEDVNYVIISHFHGDHISALRDYPNATFLTHSTAWKHFKSKKGIRALVKAYLPALIPEDFEERLIFIDKPNNTVLLDKKYVFPTAHDFFEDGSLLFIELPGHCKGQVGVLLKNENQDEFFLIADAAWNKRNIEENKLPHLSTFIIHENYKEYKSTLDKLHKMQIENQQLKVLPCHCLETFKKYGVPCHDNN